jgi:hypothetical protein
VSGDDQGTIKESFMRPTQHPSNNDVLRAPAGSTVEECRPLAITRIVFDDKTPGVVSFWLPTAAERAAIAGGAMIFMKVIGHTHPPVLIGVDGMEA